MSQEATHHEAGLVRTLFAHRTAEAFYGKVLSELLDAKFPFLVAGGYAVSAYIGVNRTTKDLDLFTTSGEFTRLLTFMKEKGYSITIEDDRWIGKIQKGEYFVDVIFGSANGMVPVGEDWIRRGIDLEILGLCVPVLDPTDLIWSKAFIKDRQRYDGADIANLILRQSDIIDWKRLLAHMDLHWEVLLSMVLEFRWIYPSERARVPRWLIENLMQRVRRQLHLPTPERKVCRGRLFSRSDYKHAIATWGYADIGGEENLRDG